MKAVIFQAPGRVSVEDRPEPVIEAPGDAIVRVTMTAVCGSDLLPYTGRRPRQAGTGMGHEVCGVVTAAGDGVTRVKQGDRVVSPFSIACTGSSTTRTPRPIPFRLSDDTSDPKTVRSSDSAPRRSHSVAWPAYCSRLSGSWL
jgi:threonine dehydrogenase-like Zn-dependent dehydrogenase